MEGSRTRCKSIEFDPIDQAADSLPVITRGRRSIARINHLAFDRLSIPIFPRGIGYLGCLIFDRQGPGFILPLQLVPLSLSLSLDRYIYETGLNVWVWPSFSFFFLLCFRAFVYHVISSTWFGYFPRGTLVINWIEIILVRIFVKGLLLEIWVFRLSRFLFELIYIRLRM